MEGQIGLSTSGRQVAWVRPGKSPSLGYCTGLGKIEGEAVIMAADSPARIRALRMISGFLSSLIRALPSDSEEAIYLAQTYLELRRELLALTKATR